LQILGYFRRQHAALLAGFDMFEDRLAGELGRLALKLFSERFEYKVL
jgi:hypothetical protein